MKRYYIAIIGLTFSGIGAIMSYYTPFIAYTTVDVVACLWMIGWMSAEVINIYRNRQNKNTLLTILDSTINITSSTAQILRLIPPLYPDKDGKFNDVQKISLSMIQAAYYISWLVGLAYINTQIEKKEEIAPHLLSPSTSSENISEVERPSTPPQLI